MAKFDLHQLLNERSKAAAEHPKNQHPTESMEQLTLDVYDLIPSEENFYSTENIDDLKRSISLVGVLQPLLVRRDGDKYHVKAGHRRRLACMALADEGQEQFRFVPCVIRQEAAEEPGGNINTILDRLSLIFANGFREKTDWEKMEEALQTEALVVELRKEVSLEGRTRSILAEFTGIKEAQLGRYKAIKNNLCPQLMEEFKADRLGISTVYELSGLSMEYQEKAVDLYRQTGTLSINDAKELKKQEEAAQQIPGQMEMTEQDYTEEREQPRADPKEEPDAPQDVQECEDTEKVAAEYTEAPQEAQQSTQGESPAQAQETAVERPQEPQQEPQRVVYVEQRERAHGCAFCHPGYHREVNTEEENFLLEYEPEGKTVLVASKETGSVDNIIFHYCPMCGRKLV